MLSLFRPRLAPDTPTRLDHANPALRRVFVVNWCLGTTCNYSCSYCPEGLHDGKQPWASLESIKAFVEKVQDHYGRDREYVFEFTGGEVTLFPDFIPMVQFLTERGCKVGIISNGSRAKAFWEKARPYLTQVCLSFHPESAKPDHFLEIARYLAEGTRVHLNFMMNPEHFWKCYEVAVEGKRIPNVSIAMQPLAHGLGTELFDYSATQKAVLEKQWYLLTRFVKRDRKDSGFRGAMSDVRADGSRARIEAHRLITSGRNSWKDWLCYAGTEQLVVDPRGQVYRGWCEVGGVIGQVGGELNFPGGPVKCSRDTCHCNFDIMCTKVRA